VKPPIEDEDEDDRVQDTVATAAIQRGTSRTVEIFEVIARLKLTLQQTFRSIYRSFDASV
jgi:hypothetical protein